MIYGLIGGAIIGIAVSIMLLFNGRVTGISGIIGGALKPKASDFGWRFMFIAGLLAGGFIIRLMNPSLISTQTNATYFDYVLGGVLVGFGTLLGNGCTSGHGVCGLSRLSIRSLVSTLTFISFGIISVLIFKMVRGSL